MSSTKLTVPEVFDKIGSNRTSIYIFILMALAIFFDGFDYMLVSYTMPQISAEWGLDSIATGSLSSWSMVGLVVGGATGGMLADKFGRKKVVWISTLLFSVLTVPIYFVPSYTWFAICRVLAGLALGSLAPVAITTVSEVMPSKRTAFFVAATTSFMPIGYTMASVAAMAIIPVAGWRGVYLVSAIGIALAIVIATTMPESPRWLMKKGDKDQAWRSLKRFIAVSKNTDLDSLTKDSLTFEALPEANDGSKREKGGLLGLFSSKTMVLTTIGIWLIYFCSSYGSYGISAWLPSLLMEKGFDMTLSYSINMVQTIASIVSNYIAGYLAVKLTRKNASVTMFAATAIALVLLALIPGSAPTLFMLVTFLGLGLGGVPASVNNLCTNVYPISCRGTGVSFMQAIGRIAGIVAPLICGALLQAGFDFSGVILSFIVPMALGIIFIFSFVRTDADGNKM